MSSRSWVVTNAWNAHSGVPVTQIFVDPWSIEKEKLRVVSVGRDERMRFWDGLLGIDWIGNELLKRECEFNSFRTINVLIVSWNIDAAKPKVLTDDTANLTFLNNALTYVSPTPDFRCPSLMMCKPPCRAILNPYCQIDIRGKLWIRPFCLTHNAFPKTSLTPIYPPSCFHN